MQYILKSEVEKMANGEITRRTAMKAEEAVLLPALLRNRGAGGAALRNALQAAEDIGKKRLGDENSAPIAAQAAENAAKEQPSRRPGSRAALHHVLRGR